MTESVPNGGESHSRTSSRVHRKRFRLSDGLAALTIVSVLATYPAHASADPRSFSPLNLASCSSTPETFTEQCHLDSNDRMKMLLGTWGKGVHPSGPNYFCFEHQKQRAESRKPGCR